MNEKEAIVMLIFLQAPSNEVRNLYVAPRNQNIDEPFNKNTTFKWSLPCRPNGKIEKFIVECAGHDPHHLLKDEVFVIGNQEEFTFITTELVPDTFYNVSVRAVTSTTDDKIMGKELTQIFRIEGGCKLNSL